MWTAILCMLIGILFFCYNEYKYSWSGSYIGSMLMGALLGFLIGMLIGIFIPPKTIITENTYEIKNLRDNSNLTSYHYLYTTNLEGKMCYVFYYQEGETYKMKTVNYQNAEIILSDGVPKVYCKTEKIVKGAFINNFSVLKHKLFSNYEDKYVFFVPRGTIKEDFVLDAQ